MPDRKRLRQIEVAADPRRYRLLEAAVVDKSFRAQDAERIATGRDSGSGTARSSHARRLASAGLLRREEDPVRYVATTTGKAVYNILRGALGKTAARDEAALVVALLELRGDMARDAVSTANDLVAALEAEIWRAPAVVRARRTLHLRKR